MVPIDIVAAVVTDELQRRQDWLLARRHKQARFRDPGRSLDSIDFASIKLATRRSRTRAWMKRRYCVARDAGTEAEAGRRCR